MSEKTKKTSFDKEKFKKIMNDLRQPENLKYYLSREHFLTIDIGTHSTKIMEIKRRGMECTIERIFTIPDMNKYFKGKNIHNPNGLVETILHLLQSENIKTKNVRLIYSSGKSQSKIIQMPEMSDKEAKSFIDISFQKQFPNHSRLSEVFDYMSVGSFRKDEKMENMILMALTSSGEASTIINEFKKKKFTVSIIDADVNVLRNIGLLYKGKDDIEERTIVDLGNINSKALFMKDKTAIFSREVSLGSSNLVKSLQNSEEISQQDAEELLKEKGLVTDENIQIRSFNKINKDDYNDLMEDNLNNALNELYRAFQFVNTNLGVDSKELILTGGMSNLNGIQNLTKNIMDLPVTIWNMNEEEVLDLPNGCTIKNNSGLNVNGSFARCFGMAIRGAIE